MLANVSCYPLFVWEIRTTAFPSFYILNDDSPLITELLKVWLQCQVVVYGLDIGWEYFATLRDVHASTWGSSVLATHGSLIRALST